MSVCGHILDFLLPTACSYCSSSLNGSSLPFFCADCWKDFSVLTGPLCPLCGKPFESLEALSASPEHSCGMCRLDPPVFDQALSIGYFEGALREAVHQFKYRPCRSLGRPLGEWMAGNLQPLQGVDFIVPVPLHRSRLHQRGFNQALLLADRISKRFSIPLCYDTLIRTRPTRPQVELSGVERLKNVAGAFSIVSPHAIKNSSVVLVDDVFTTGATMNACSSVLKAAGAAQVAALTLARAV